MAVEYGRILPSRALLAARNNTLGIELVISRHSLTGLRSIYDMLARLDFSN